MAGRRLRRGLGAFGAIAAIIFNLALFALPFTVGGLMAATASADIFAYADTPAARAATRRHLETLAARLQRGEKDRRSAWGAIILRELDQGDYAAARGFLLAGPAMLGPRESTQLRGQIPPGATDRQIAAAALELLEPHVREALTARDALAGLDAENAFIIGDARDVALASGAYLRGEANAFTLVLAGVGIATPASPMATAGASLLRASAAAGALPANFRAAMGARLEAAFPEARLRAALTAASPEGLEPMPEALTGAFQSAMSVEHYRLLAEDLEAIGAIAAATSPAAGAVVLGKARDLKDLARLRLIARAGGDRAVAVAKVTPNADAYLASARGTLLWPAPFVGALFWLAVNLAALFGALARVVQLSYEARIRARPPKFAPSVPTP